MQNTPYQQLELFWKAKGLKNAAAFSESVPGLTAAALSAMKRRGSLPSAPIMRHIQVAYPDLNPDYILFGEGEMYKEGRALSPAPVPNTSAPATPVAAEPEPLPYGDAVELAVANARIADRDETIRQQQFKIDELNRELGKPFNGLDAASTPTPTPRNPIGFALSVSHRVKNKGAARPL